MYLEDLINSYEICGNRFKELHIKLAIQLKTKTKYLQHFIISRFRKRHFINSFDASEVLGLYNLYMVHLILFFANTLFNKCGNNKYIFNF